MLAHNKTLAASLCEEFRAFFPENAVEYFVSYYDYYQPEAYIPHTDTFIEKDAAINDEIERLRHSATAALFERRDVIVVSSVSCIYGLGDPIDYANMVISLRQGKEYPRTSCCASWWRSGMNATTSPSTGTCSGSGGHGGDLSGVRQRICHPGGVLRRRGRPHFPDQPRHRSGFQRVLQHVAIYPASHYVTTKDKMERAAAEIERELAERKKVV